jgi:hypothetical protein
VIAVTNIQANTNAWPLLMPDQHQMLLFIVG